MYRFLIQIKGSTLGKKNATKDISKEEKRAPELRQEWKG